MSAVVPFRMAPAERADILQARESMRRERLARLIAEEALEDFDALDRRRQAFCRYLACHVLRSQQDTWIREADRKAKDALIRSLRTECGASFAGLSQPHYETLASVLLHAMKSAYFGVTEGSSPMVPGDYVRVVGGEE